MRVAKRRSLHWRNDLGRRAADAQRVHHGIEIGHAVEPHQALLHLAARFQHPAVPVGHLAEDQATEALAALFHQAVEMPFHETEPVRMSGRQAWSARGDSSLDL